MIKEIKIKTIKHGYNYISECEVLDTETNETYYVVTQFGNLFYKTFKNSYMDYVLGKTKVEPIQIEGDDYMWTDFSYDCGVTRFCKQYKKTFEEASKLEHRDYINHKYAHLKKPLGNIKFKILNKRRKCVYGCGPMGEIYEIEFLILDDNSNLYVYSDDSFGAFSITDYSVYDSLESEEDGNEFEYIDSIEEISDFSKAKKSKYYDLYLEMEKYKDDYEE